MTSRTFEYLVREVLNCDQPERLLTFGGIANSGMIEQENGFYMAAISTLAVLHSHATCDQASKIDFIIEELSESEGKSMEQLDNDYTEMIYDSIVKLKKEIL